MNELDQMKMLKESIVRIEEGEVVDFPDRPKTIKDAEWIVDMLDDIISASSLNYAQYHTTSSEYMTPDREDKLSEFIMQFPQEDRKKIFVLYYTGPSNFEEVELNEIKYMAKLCGVGPVIQKYLLQSGDRDLSNFDKFQQYLERITT